MPRSRQCWAGATAPCASGRPPRPSPGPRGRAHAVRRPVRRPRLPRRTAPFPGKCKEPTRISRLESGSGRRLRATSIGLANTQGVSESTASVGLENGTSPNLWLRAEVERTARWWRPRGALLRSLSNRTSGRCVSRVAGADLRASIRYRRTNRSQNAPDRLRIACSAARASRWEFSVDHSR